MTFTFKAAVFGAALAVGGLTTSMLPATASAMTLNLGPLVNTSDGLQSANNVEKVGHSRRRHRRVRRQRRPRRYIYNNRRHGPRYRYRRGRHKHYYNGYYYAVPFWLGAAAIGSHYYDPYYDVAPSHGGNAHVRWCLNRYRSYNPATDTFRGYDGLNHRCRSPY